MEFMIVAIAGPCLFFIGAAIFSALNEKKEH
jgi:hypothetical protein